MALYARKQASFARPRSFVINPRVSCTRLKTVPITKSVLSVEKHILTKVVTKKEVRNLKVQTVGELLLSLTTAVLFTRNRPSDSMLFNNKFLTLQS